MKNSEIQLQFVPEHLKIEKMCKHAVKKLPFLVRYAPDQYRTQQMCDKAILENGAILKDVPDFYGNQEICNKQLVITLMHYNLFLDAIRLKKCVINLLILILLQ